MEEPFFYGDWFPPDNPEQISERLIERLIKAVDDGNFDQVQELLAEGVNPNVSDEETLKPFLAVASLRGETEILKALLEAGADPNLEDDERYTSLMFAAHRGHLEVVQTLLNAGANINAMNKDSNTALSMAFWAEQQEVVEYLLPLVSDEERKHIASCKNYVQENSVEK